MASNEYRKHTFEDKFIRMFCCKNRVRRYTRYTKRANRKIFRRAFKRLDGDAHE